MTLIPNWHPLVVHFAVALLLTSVGFHLFQALLPKEHRWQSSLSLLARSNLWLGTVFAIITALAGWYAYNTVTHDAPSHAAMTEHRNWALVTIPGFIVLSVYSMFSKAQKMNMIFMLVLLVFAGLLSKTAWLGGEAVYRYGLGVISLPQASGDGHDHKHSDKLENNSSHDMEKTTPHQDDTHSH